MYMYHVRKYIQQNYIQWDGGDPCEVGSLMYDGKIQDIALVKEDHTNIAVGKVVKKWGRFSRIWKVVVVDTFDQSEPSLPTAKKAKCQPGRHLLLLFILCSLFSYSWILCFNIVPSVVSICASCFKSIHVCGYTLSEPCISYH